MKWLIERQQIGYTGWNVVLVNSMSSLDFESYNLHYVAWFTLLLVGVILIFLDILLFRSFTDPVYRLLQTMQEFGKGNYDIKAKEEGIGELKNLSAHFNIMADKLQEQMEEIRRNERERQQMEKKLLQSQINPHFLFNTLNLIAGTAEIEDAVTTEKMINTLSRLFRYNLKTQTSIMPLEQEVKIMDDYMYLQQMRFGQRIKYMCDVDKECMDELVPAFVLQPLIENAIIHCYNKIVILSPKIQDAKRLRLANIQEERMVTGAIKNKVDKIWTDIWAGGITNPLTVIEQLTYLMFIRSLDEKELATEDFENMAGEKMEHIFPASAAGQSMRWSRFKDKDSREIFLTMQQRVFPAIKKMKYGRLPDFDANGELVEIADDPTRPDEGNTAFARYMDDAMFLIPTPQVLQKIITGLEDLYTHDIADLDMQGDLYEYMLGKLATAGQNGQFRTPKHIRDMIVEMVQPTPDDFICDPACGTAGFLVSSAQYLRAHYEDSMTSEQWQHFAGPMFTGFDMDRTMLRISAMNLMLHSITNPEIDYKDSVSKQNSICSKYTVCLANPPFKGTVDAESINDDLKAVTNTKKTELLFLALFLRMLKTGGRCACIVPDGVLFGSSKAHQSIRKELIENHQLRAVISMPSGVFKPYAGVSTAVLVFTKTGAGGTDKVWFYDMKADGFSLDDKRTEVKENDIPDIIARFHNLDAETDRKRTEQSFFVPKAEIAANGYDLSINKYKETEYVPVEYPSTTEILANLHELEMEITKGLAELEEMV